VERARLPAVFGVAGVLCAAWTVFAGKDVNWDLLNYHYYLPQQLLAGRLQQDFFAASAQSYLNPVGYLLFYWMLASGWHSVIVSVLLALAHSLSLGLLWLMAQRLFAHLPPRERGEFSLLAVALGVATSVFWATVGSSFLDPLLVPPMLGGLLLLLDGGTRAVRHAAYAGLLFGLAAALKYSNAVFALAALPLAMSMPGLRGAARLRSLLAYAAGAAAAVLVLAGPWLVLMAQEFGNPVFPLLNAWFRSPDAPAVNLVSERFRPAGLVEALSFPLRAMALDRDVYSETLAPDLRFAVLLAALLALPVARVRRFPAASALARSDWRLLAFFAGALAAWLWTSANARYGMIVLLLCGLCLARLGERLLPQRPARIALAVLLAVQLGTMIVASPSRWFLAEPWSAHWLPYTVPAPALQKPALYLTVEPLPMAVIAPLVHPASSFVNFRGLHSIPTTSARLARLMKEHDGGVRTLGRALQLNAGRPREEAVRSYDRTLARIGYRVDASDCFTIAWQPDDQDPLSRAANWLARKQRSSEPLSVVSCALRAAVRDPADVEEERRVSAIFDRMEQACPELFSGQTAVTEPLGSGWSRHYAGLDARLETHAGRVVLNRYRALEEVHLGRLAEWEAANLPALRACDNPR
jgi:hypothetical protein